ncbi:MAG: response regulator [Oscillospiraceae bacterium]|nr:response regulator [Oscillospiraceae bacterium]
MYRVILIDDEPLIVEGLQKVMRWERYRCTVVATAGDAEKGAELIRTLHPHILFTDIRMPGIDGLAMLAGLRSEFPDLQVTVLTGYRDFTYAQEAIRLGVTRYLLKPSKMDEICEALEAMTAHLKQEPQQTGGNPAKTSERENAGSFLVNRAVSYMEEHYAEKIALQDVADACYVSQWHLSKLLNRYTGKNFYDLLNARRIRAAKELLADPSLRIRDIGEMVGYADTAHFARVFRKIAGMSANEYRNSL